MEKELLLSKKDLEIEHLKFAPQRNTPHEKQVQELNDKLQAMQSERNQLLTKVAELEKKVNEKKVESHESFALAQVKSQLIQMQEAYEEMQKANTDQPLPNQNRVFTMLMQALAKARKLL